MANDKGSGSDGFGMDAEVSWLSFVDTSDARALNAGRVALLLGFDLAASLARSNAVLALLAASATSGEPVDRDELTRRLGRLNEFQAQQTEGLQRLFDAIGRLEGESP
jgi:hypothetical protein